MGPFELRDKLGDKHQSEAEWLILKLELENRAVPKLLKQVGKNSFYRAEQKNMYVYSLNDTYKPLPVLSDEWQ